MACYFSRREKYCDSVILVILINMATYCTPKFVRNGGHEKVYQPDCLTAQFNDGYYSHIRGKGSGLLPHSHVFPGTQEINKPGRNSSIFVSNPDIGNIIEVKRNYDGLPGAYKIFPRYPNSPQSIYPGRTHEHIPTVPTLNYPIIGSNHHVGF
jgi:hypothetical protein